MDVFNNEDVKRVECDGYLILYHKTMGVLAIEHGERHVLMELQRCYLYNDYGEYMNHIYDNEDFMAGLEKRVNELFDLALKVQDIDGTAYCHISSSVFTSATVYTQFLKFFNLYHNAIKFLYKMMNFATVWENNHKPKEIHKGALYGFIGEMYMHVLDYEMGFTYLHRSVKEDRRIKKFIPTYPEDAPSYKIMYLKGTTDHFMSGYVQSVRNDLNSHLDLFTKQFPKYAGFNLNSFDAVFTDNKFYDKGTLEDVKAQILYCIWSRYYYKMKVAETVKILGAFDNLNRVNKLFTLCVNIEMLSKELGISKKIIKGSKEKFPNNRTLQEELHVFLGGTKTKFDEFFDYVDRKDDMIDQLIKDLLIFDEKKYDGKDIDPLIRCTLLYILIRNFTAHNVKSIDTIGNNFFEIYKALLYLLFILLIEADRQGYTKT